jgi:hypothetical protein
MTVKENPKNRKNDCGNIWENVQKLQYKKDKEKPKPNRENFDFFKRYDD